MIVMVPETTAIDCGSTVEVTSVSQLRDLVGEPLPRTANKVRARLEPVHREWLAASPFCLLATAGGDGRCDVSPKGDPPGFVRVLDDRTVVVPDRKGNKRLDGLGNILANPHVGLVHLIPHVTRGEFTSSDGRGDTLRVNGRARIVSEAPFFDAMTVAGRRPQLAIVVDVEEVFFHCAKAFLRSKLWDADSWRPDTVASRAVIEHELERPGDDLADLERYYGRQYAQDLY